jgi:hypothetical protein
MNKRATYVGLNTGRYHECAKQTKQSHDGPTPKSRLASRLLLAVSSNLKTPFIQSHCHPFALFQEMSEAQKGRKRVRLVQEPEVNIFDEHEMSETDRDRIWWRQEDFEEAKASVKRMCRGLRKERRFSGCLTDAYERACCMTSTCSGSLEAMPENHWEALRTNKVRKRKSFSIVFRSLSLNSSIYRLLLLVFWLLTGLNHTIR